MRKRMPAAQMKREIHSWPRHDRLRFDFGVEDRQSTPNNDGTLQINASGLLKLIVAFKGRLGQFLDRQSNSYPNAQRFLERIAKPIASDQPIIGSTANYTAPIVKVGGHVQYMLSRKSFHAD